MAQLSLTIFMLVTLSMAGMEASDFCMVPMTVTVWPTCAERSSLDMSSTPSGCFLVWSQYLPSFLAMQPVQDFAALAEPWDCMEPLSCDGVCAKAGVQQRPKVRAASKANFMSVLLFSRLRILPDWVAMATLPLVWEGGYTEYAVCGAGGCADACPCGCQPELVNGSDCGPNRSR